MAFNKLKYRLSNYRPLLRLNYMDAALRERGKVSITSAHIYRGIDHVQNRVVKCDVTNIKICEIMGFVEIIRDIKT